jgi:hypothetical protein
MRRPRLSTFALATALCGTCATAEPIPVNAGNFAIAESHRYMSAQVAAGGLGALVHERQPVAVDAQTVIRMNRDTLYSSGVFDLAAGPITIEVPKGDGRYVAVEPVSEDHFTPGVFHEGTHTLTEADVGTRHVSLLIRVFADASDPADLARAHAVQDALKVTQGATGSWAPPEWDKATLDKTRDLLASLSALGTEGLSPRMGPRGTVNPVGHLLATAAGWGLNPDTEARYVLGQPAANDGTTVHRLTMADVPVDGFWSVTVYGPDGYMVKNDLDRYSINNVTAKAGSGGAVTVQFGGCTAGVENCIPTPAGWNYTLRFYRPKAGLLDGSWTVPEAVPAG